MVERTLEAASRFAQAAFADAADNRPVEALAHAGIALELLAKAVLIHIHPLLVVDAPGGRINLAGVELALKGGGVLAEGTRTIRAEEALRRCDHLVKDFDQKSCAELIGLRNGSVHIGYGDADRVAKALVTLVDAAEGLLPAVEVDKDEFWGAYAASAASRLAEHVDEVRQRVADLLAAAAARWERTRADLDDTLLDALLSAAPGFVMEDNQEPWECPACHETAVLHGQFDLDVDVDWDYDDGEMHPVGTHQLVLVPDRLTCPYCRLRLAGRAELLSAEIPPSVPIERGPLEQELLEARYADDYDPADRYD